jgi:transposase
VVAVLGRKTFEPKLFYQLSLEERVSEEHLLRRVAAAVDFSFVRRLTARFYSHTGQPGIDPVVLFKMALVGWLYGITSERRLADELRLNLAFMWFVGYDLDERTPDHSVLSKARARFGLTVYEAFFTEIVRQCERAGLIRGDRLYLDSTLVEANADLATVGARALVAQLAGVDEHLAAVWDENPAAASDAAGEPTVAASVAVPEPVGPHLASRDDPPNGPRGPVNEQVVSRTDPDAGLVARSGVPLDLYHKVHVGVDGAAARIITAVDVTPGEVADEHLLDRLIKEHEGTTGRTVTEVVADTKYGTYANYATLEQAGIAASIPSHAEAGQRRAVPRELFVYDPAGDQFLCPEGRPLRRQGSSCTAGPNGGIIYRASPKACGACPRRTACCGSAKARTLTRPNDGGVAERVGTYLATPHARRSIRLRKCWAETAIGELKDRHGLRRAQYRGRANVRMQALGAAMAYNIKKLARRHGRRPQAPALARRSGPGQPPPGETPLRHRGDHPRLSTRPHVLHRHPFSRN